MEFDLHHDRRHASIPECAREGGEVQFARWDENKLHYMATVLDPRIKTLITAHRSPADAVSIVLEARDFVKAERISLSFHSASGAKTTGGHAQLVVEQVETAPARSRHPRRPTSTGTWTLLW
ncbi:hypothetical protein AYO21_10706 [Fonsecaea monophora]|uniref:Uncharacterized protein n=1 Tax=Fonsecaea monophora TaxID=254056 RepID=A0A177EW15_9EURO|nr:hypothetical protein AYO21_10706 [Fonsecaea monophora]OAG35139.1 hypothetical protein AYO21_10706 [Fonsecaea monophora]